MVYPYTKGYRKLFVRTIPLDSPELVEQTGIYENRIFHRKSKEEIKKMVRNHELMLLSGTDAASEGLNLQALGTLINLDFF